MILWRLELHMAELEEVHTVARRTVQSEDRWRIGRSVAVVPRISATGHRGDVCPTFDSKLHSTTLDRLDR